MLTHAQTNKQIFQTHIKWLKIPTCRRQISWLFTLKSWTWGDQEQISCSRKEGLNPQPPDYKSSTLTTQPCCLILLSKMCSVFSESKPRPLAKISRSTHVSSKPLHVQHKINLFPYNVDVLCKSLISNLRLHWPWKDSLYMDVVLCQLNTYPIKVTLLNEKGLVTLVLYNTKL